MITRKAYKAFTLVEVLVVISLTSIVLSIGYIAYLSFQSYFISYRTGVQHTNEITSTLSIIQTQFQSSNALYLVDSTIIIVGPKEDTIKVVFTGPGVELKSPSVNISCDSVSLISYTPACQKCLLDTVTLSIDHNHWIFIKQYSTEQQVIFKGANSSKS